jgi:hypothetical protein
MKTPTRGRIIFRPSAETFCKALYKHIEKHRISARNHCMHNPRDGRGQNRSYSDQHMWDVAYRGRHLAVQLFRHPRDNKGTLLVQVLSERNGRATNTQHVTLTHTNWHRGEYYVKPRLGKCLNGKLMCQPRRVIAYPIRSPGKGNEFNVGPMGSHILARVFEVAIAKYDSIPTKKKALQSPQRLAQLT